MITSVLVALVAQSGPWSTGSAFTAPEDRVELALLGTSRWVFAKDLELGFRPLAFFVHPHLDLKVYWGESGGFHFGSRHRLSYPSLFLRFVAREGTGGLLPNDTPIPAIVGLGNTLLASKPWGDQIFTGYATVSVAPRLGDADPPLLDFPFLYPRFAALETVATFELGARADGALLPWLAYHADLACHLLPGSGWALEQGATLALRPNDSFSFSLGYRLSAAQYPAGFRAHVLPVLDLVAAF